MNLSRYTKMIADSNLSDDLDNVLSEYAPKRNQLDISTPALTWSVFDGSPSSYRYSGETPLNLMDLTEVAYLPEHLAVTAAIVYNRDPKRSKAIEYKSFHEVAALF